MSIRYRVARGLDISDPPALSAVVQRWELAEKSTFMGRAGGEVCGTELLSSFPCPVLKDKRKRKVALENACAVL